MAGVKLAYDSFLCVSFSPRNLANAGSQSWPAQLGRLLKRCWNRRKSPARSTTVCCGTLTARVGTAHPERTHSPQSVPAPRSCHGGKDQLAGVVLTLRQAWGRGTVLPLDWGEASRGLGPHLGCCLQPELQEPHLSHCVLSANKPI